MWAEKLRCRSQVFDVVCVWLSLAPLRSYGCPTKDSDRPRLGGLTIVETFGRKVPAKHQASVASRLMSVARVIVPDWKLSVSVTCVSMYLYIIGTYL